MDSTTDTAASAVVAVDSPAAYLIVFLLTFAYCVMLRRESCRHAPPKASGSTGYQRRQIKRVLLAKRQQNCTSTDRAA